MKCYEKRINRKIFEKMYKTFGTRQLAVVMEELAELIQMVSKIHRKISLNQTPNPDLVTKTLDEIADVYLMTDQLIYILHLETGLDEKILTEIIEEHYNFKLNKLPKYLNEINIYEEQTKHSDAL